MNGGHAVLSDTEHKMKHCAYLKFFYISWHRQLEHSHLILLIHFDPAL